MEYFPTQAITEWCQVWWQWGRETAPILQRLKEETLDQYEPFASMQPSEYAPHGLMWQMVQMAAHHFLDDLLQTRQTSAQHLQDYYGLDLRQPAAFVRDALSAEQWPSFQVDLMVYMVHRWIVEEAIRAYQDATLTGVNPLPTMAHALVTWPNRWLDWLAEQASRPCSEDERHLPADEQAHWLIVVTGWVRANTRVRAGLRRVLSQEAQENESPEQVLLNHLTPEVALALQERQPGDSLMVIRNRVSNAIRAEFTAGRKEQRGLEMDWFATAQQLDDFTMREQVRMELAGLTPPRHAGLISPVTGDSIAADLLRRLKRAAKLSPSEAEVIEAVQADCTNEMIATQRGCSINTVKQLRKRCMDKLQSAALALHSCPLSS